MKKNAEKWVKHLIALEQFGPELLEKAREVYAEIGVEPTDNEIAAFALGYLEATFEAAAHVKKHFKEV